MSSREQPDPPQPLVADGGLPATMTDSSRDPFQALDELMVVVEALCPVWPERPTFEGTARYLL